MTKLKVGVIGVGGIAQDRHIPALLKLKDTVSLVAVQDINTVQMIDVAKRFNIPHAVETPSELFKLVDAVVICTPNKFHADLSIEALNHGVHVLCEKPMAMTTEECDRMIEATNKNCKLLTVAYHYRHTDVAITAKKAIESGVVGKPLVARVQAMRRRKVPGWGVFTNKALQGGGSLIDYGCHLLDLSLWLLGKDMVPHEVLGKNI